MGRASTKRIASGTATAVAVLLLLLLLLLLWLLWLRGSSATGDGTAQDSSIALTIVKLTFREPGAGESIVGATGPGAAGSGNLFASGSGEEVDSITNILIVVWRASVKSQWALRVGQAPEPGLLTSSSGGGDTAGTGEAKSIPRVEVLSPLSCDIVRDAVRGRAGTGLAGGTHRIINLRRGHCGGSGTAQGTREAGSE
jgi:hypothetical protein